MLYSYADKKYNITVWHGIKVPKVKYINYTRWHILVLSGYVIDEFMFSLLQCCSVTVELIRIHLYASE